MIHYFLVLAALAAVPRLELGQNDLVHARTEFHFTVDLPYADAAPLFGAWAEQKWAPEFKPQFLYPVPPADREGAVFLVQKGEYSSLWVNTAFDLPGGHVQYVYVLEQRLVTRIDIRLKKNGGRQTGVSVAYERTALNSAANDQVKTLAKADAGSADEWRNAINAYAAKMKTGR